VVDQFMTDTAREADLVLPAKTMFEQSDVIGAYWHHCLQLKQKAIAPPGEVRPESEVYWALAARLGFAILEVPALFVGGERVSDSRIRALVTAGCLAEAARLLGRRYAVVGEVTRGDGRGRELGFPTANLAFAAPVTLPPDGIYAVRAGWGGPDPRHPAHVASGVASLGVRPTFGGGERILEAHLFDVGPDLYGRRLRVEFVRRQRGERRFGTAAALVVQMERDATRAREILATT